MIKKLIRVLYIHQDGNISGSAISLRNLIASLDRNRFHPHVLLGREGEARAFLESLRIRVDVIPLPFFATAPGPRWYQFAASRQFRALLPNRALEHFIHNTNPDLIHINDKAALSAGMTAHKLGKPIIQHLRSSYANTRLPWNSWISRAIIRKYANHLIAISEDETDGFEDLEHLSIVYNSVDLVSAEAAEENRDKIRSELSLYKNCLAIGMVGNLTEQKGVWDFLRAAGEVTRQLPDIKFVIVSPIPERNSWNSGISGKLGFVHAQYPLDHALKIARQVGILDKLIFTGYRRDILNVMASLDVIVACFKLPAIGRPAFESMSVGRPVITNTGHSGRSKIVINGETGFTISSGDVPALAKTMIFLAKNPDLRKEMGRNGKIYARKHFDPHKNAQEVMKIYQKVAAK